MSKFRKKPVVIEALHLTEEVFWESQKDGGFGRLPEPFNKFCFSGSYNPEHKTIRTVFISIPTLEGTMRADLGDWIIRGIKGEFYPCKPDIFEKTYEPESAKPPASEGVRLSVDEAIFKIEDYVGVNIEGVDTIDRMSFTRFLRQTLESLAALPELEKRECLNCQGLGTWQMFKEPKICDFCNGHGEVWVRKAGV